MSGARPRLDPAIHAVARLQIAGVLAAVAEAEFAVVREAVGVSDSVLSKHVSALSEAGYVRLRKAASGGRQRTWLALTREGRRAFGEHVAALQSLAAAAGAAPSVEKAAGPAATSSPSTPPSPATS